MNRHQHQRAEREAAAIFGRLTVQAVQANPRQAEADLLGNAQAVHTGIEKLRPLLGNIKAAVTFGQSLPQAVQRGVIFLWLGYSRKRKTLESLGIKYDQ